MCEQIEQLVRAFSGLLYVEAGEAALREAVIANACEINPDVCHSLDCCNAYELMVTAFERFTGRAYCSSESPKALAEDVKLFDQAWDLAKQNSFYIDS